MFRPIDMVRPRRRLILWAFSSRISFRGEKPDTALHGGGGVWVSFALDRDSGTLGDLVHAGLRASARENLLRDFENSLTVTLRIGSWLAGDFLCG